MKRRKKAEEGEPVERGPHLCIEYPEDRQIFHDANELIIHYVKRHMNPRQKKGKYYSTFLLFLFLNNF
jgi:hypothetical protein